MHRVAFAGTFATRLEPRVRAALGPPFQIILGDEMEIARSISEVESLVTMAFTREMGAAAARLKLIQVPGAGLDRIDRAAIPDGVWLANAYGHDTGIAEYAMGAMLALTRDLARLDGALRRGVWESQWAVGAPTPAPWPELAGKTLGILGYGRIGQALARRARAFDMEVRAIRRDATRSDPQGLAFLGGPEALDGVLRHADHVAITLSLTEATRGLLGRRELGLMKPTAVLVNVARAEIVDEDALYEALAGKAIAGAALDVWYRYPSGPGPAYPARRPFHELPNVLMTPHVSGWTEGMLEARARTIAENIHRAARGEPPANLIQR
ncbi:MAG TPA: 2-hydroxyacid dehydrogenase [Candidatus Methylomirabilis sp.]|nr:2-hydroxyacid dehydrogenase [Candidatus Methylomirabilis sp.]